MSFKSYYRSSIFIFRLMHNREFQSNLFEWWGSVYLVDGINLYLPFKKCSGNAWD